MKHSITIQPKGERNAEVEFSLDTAEAGVFSIRAYGATLNFEEFVEFADAINDIREKFAVTNAKYEQAHETGDAE